MKYLFFDIECSNCFNGIGKMCEFGYVLTDENFKIISKDDIPMNPGDRSEDRFYLTGRKNQKDLLLAYDEDYYYSCPKFTYFYDKIKLLIEGKDTICFAFSAMDDVMHLANQCKRYKLPQFEYNCYDVQEFAAWYLEMKGQKNLEYCFDSIVGHHERMNLQKHFSRDDAVMTMMILEAIEALTKTNLDSLLKQERFTKYELPEYFSFAQQRSEQKKQRNIAHLLYKHLVEKSSALIDDEKFIGKRYNLSSSLKTSLEQVNEIAVKVKSLGGILADTSGKTDIFIVDNEQDLERMKTALTNYRGEFILLNDL